MSQPLQVFLMHILSTLQASLTLDLKQLKLESPQERNGSPREERIGIKLQNSFTREKGSSDAFCFISYSLELVNEVINCIKSINIYTNKDK
jgi:hypothetical protein